MMKKFALGKHWEFREAATDEISRDGTLRLRSDRRWWTAKVPGNVFLDLMKHKLIPDPFKGTNESKVQWVEERHWVYRTEFVIGDKILKALQNGANLDLYFEGLDTFATIFLNRQKLGAANNMLIPWQFNISKMVKRGNNELVVFFHSPRLIGEKLIKQYGKIKYSSFDKSRSYLRRAQFLTGWDWAPRLSGVGIWRPVFLRLSTIARIENIFINIIKINRQQAEVALEIELAALKAATLALRMSISLDAESQIEWALKVKLKKGTNIIREKVKLTRPHLWWPAGYGSQPLYTATIRIASGDRIIDNRTESFGLRSLKLLRQADKQGESFIFVVNGKKIFCRGMNWVPADILLPRLTETDYYDLLSVVREANANCLRVWGGGIYENDIFYQLCDRWGIMVWQDFMFACAHYPEGEWFVDAVRKEVEAVVKRLRNHPSIILWCGNNENEMLHYLKFREDYQKMPGYRLFNQIIPQVCGRLDPTRPYWQSSPFGGTNPNSENYGDRHNWVVWHNGRGVEAYREDKGRFLSEFGVQALPCLRTIRSFAKELALNLDLPIFKVHQKMPQGNKRILYYLKRYAWQPRTFEDLIYLTQLIQAEALRTGVEYWRSRKFATSGTLIWQLNDCWPVISWSLIDYYHRPKAAYYYARRFFSPIYIILNNFDGKLRCLIVNDTIKDYRCRVNLVSSEFGGRRLAARTYNVVVRKNSRICLPPVVLKDLKITNQARQFVFAQVMRGRRAITENSLLFVPFKSIQLLKSEIKINSLKSKGNNVFELELLAPVFVKAVEIYCPIKRWELRAEDNFFDLIPGIPRRLQIRFNQPVTAKQAWELISFRSLNQFMNR